MASPPPSPKTAFVIHFSLPSPAHLFSLPGELFNPNRRTGGLCDRLPVYVCVYRTSRQGRPASKSNFPSDDQHQSQTPPPPTVGEIYKIDTWIFVFS